LKRRFALRFSEIARVLVRHRARSYHFVIAMWRAKEAESESILSETKKYSAHHATTAIAYAIQKFISTNQIDDWLGPLPCRDQFYALHIIEEDFQHGVKLGEGVRSIPGAKDGF
jgi:hypothetical protein